MNAGDEREFELSDEQVARLLKASEPVPYIVVGGKPPPSPQERANLVWHRLGDELDFDWTTVRPVPGKPQRFFTARERDLGSTTPARNEP